MKMYFQILCILSIVALATAARVKVIRALKRQMKACLTNSDLAIEENLIAFLSSIEPKQRPENHEELIKLIFSRGPCQLFMFDFYLYSRNQTDLENLGKFSTRPHRDYLIGNTEVTSHIAMNIKKKSAYADAFNDPLWPHQWYFQDYRTRDGPVMDHNVVPVHRMGITGKGVVVGVVDTGVQPDHPDLKENFLPNLSYHFETEEVGGFSKRGSYADKSMPQSQSHHGTNTAGLIAMVANNSECGVGVAYHAKIASLVFPKVITDVDSARILSYKTDQIDIYSNAWGNRNDGVMLLRYQSSKLTVESIKKGFKEGRGGKGSTYVFAAGNMRQVSNCACDPLMTHPDIILASSATQYGRPAFYSEQCANLMTTSYSAGYAMSEDQVITLDPGSRCSNKFQGTSATCPIIAGIIALALEANPKLTSHDIMHLIVMSSEVAPLAAVQNTWFMNGAGFWVSHDFGFGLLDAESMVLFAKSWTNVGNRLYCQDVQRNLTDNFFEWQSPAFINIETDACKGKITFLEHVQLFFSINYFDRGGISVVLTSPKGTKATMMAPRVKDESKFGMSWTSTSTQTWGENPSGVWHVEVKANRLPKFLEEFYGSSTSKNEPLPEGNAIGQVLKVRLYFRGLKLPPKNLKLPRTYAGFRMANGQTDLG